MTLAGIARHRSWRMLPLWTFAAGVNTSVLLGIVAYRSVREEVTLSTLALALVGWVGVATYLAFADVRTRCSHFEMSLPVRARDLWLRNIFTHLVGGLVVIGSTLGVIVAHFAFRSGLSVTPRDRLLMVALVLGVVLATMLLQIPKPSLAKIPSGSGHIVWTVLVLAGTPLLLALTSSWGLPGLALLVVLVVIVAVRLYVSVPAAYSMLPKDSQPVDHDATTTRVPTGDPSRWLLPMTIARCVSAGPKELLVIPIVFLVGVVLGGGLLAMGLGSERELRYLYLPMAIYMMFAVIGPRLASLHYLDALPIPRRSLIAMLVIPYLLLLAAGYGAGAYLAIETRAQLEYVNFEEGEEGFHVTAPLRVYKMSQSGTVPAAMSPWGESYQPDALRPLEWISTTVYSPYGSSPTNSARFVALQISRAAEEVYGLSISLETIEQRYLITREDGSVVPRGEGLTLRTDYPDIKAAAGPMFPVLMTLVAAPWLLLVALLLRAYRPGVREWVRQTIVWGSLGVLMAFWVWTSMTTLFGVMEPWAIRSVVEIVVIRVGQSSVGIFVAWMVALALLITTYRIAHRQFLRMEIVTHPSQYTLIRMGSD